MDSSSVFNFQIDTSGLSGQYTIKVITSVIDGICDKTNDVISQKSVNINVVSGIMQNPVADAGSDRTVCLNENVVLDGSDSYDPDGTIVSYLWNFDDGFNSAQSVVTRAFTSLGVFTGTLVVTDNDNLGSQDNLVVTVINCTSPTNQAPIADAGSDRTAQIGQVLQFSGSGSYDPDGTIVSYLWNFGDSNYDSGMNVNHAYSINGTYTVTLVVTDNLGAQDSDTSIVYIGV
ncbi:PKD domain-containing protein, partial [Candidatus Woesearchaeota archaeon]|nr:PKD domain-containing protein [Candidatus Woesearchaeota archaeon]